jgi:hypothetical protein
LPLSVAVKENLEREKWVKVPWELQQGEMGIGEGQREVGP